MMHNGKMIVTIVRQTGHREELKVPASITAHALARIAGIPRNLFGEKQVHLQLKPRGSKPIEAGHKLQHGDVVCLI